MTRTSLEDEPAPYTYVPTPRRLMHRRTATYVPKLEYLAVRVAVASRRRMKSTRAPVLFVMLATRPLRRYSVGYGATRCESSRKSRL